MSEWVIAPNPAYEGKQPTRLVAECHDRTPFLSIRCPRCAGELHVHESQIDAMPADAIAALRCPLCGDFSDAPRELFSVAFAWMRAEGWIE